jgi:hypothetical protein
MNNILSYKVLLVRKASHIHNHMYRRSNKSIPETLINPAAVAVVVAPSPLSSSRQNDDDLLLLERKITLVTEGFTTTKFCELVLRDRDRLSKENALTIC